MRRADFRKRFGTTGVVVLPVIHVLDTLRTQRNIDIAFEQGAPGCFLINHDFGVDAFLPIVRDVRRRCPSHWLGVNFLGVTGRDAFPTLGDLARENLAVEAYWADDARIDEKALDSSEANEIARIRAGSGWDGLYFGGTAFKKQRPVDPADYQIAAAQAALRMDVVTTSGVATGAAAEAGKINSFRSGVGDAPLAIASGITPDNAMIYGDADCFMVATGINHEDSFYDIDPARLRALLSVADDMEAGHGQGSA